MTAGERSIQSDEADGGGFGMYLKAQREAKGIALQQVAQRTNIQPEILIHIETERLDQLPEQVYIKGFVRAYAEAIGVDPQAAVRRYERHYAAYQQALSARQMRGRRRYLRRLLLAAACLAGLGLALAGLLPREPESSSPTASPAAQPDSIQTTPAPPAPAVADTAAANGRATPGQPLKLSAVGLKETTLKVIVDGKRPKVYQLKTDTRLEIEAQREFNILVSDARAVTLYLDGQPVVIPGREGQQVTLQLP